MNCLFSHYDVHKITLGGGGSISTRPYPEDPEDPDIIVGTETWLNSSVYSSEFLPSTYQIFRRDRSTDTTGGGVFLAIKYSLIAQEEPNIQTDCESIWASMHVKGKPAIYIGAFYRKHFGKNQPRYSLSPRTWKFH